MKRILTLADMIELADIMEENAVNLERKFNFNFKTIVFCFNAKMYVIPKTYKFFGILKENGFKRFEKIKVPFMYQDFPKEWEYLLELIQQDFQQDCIEFSNKEGFKPIDEKFLEAHFVKIPLNGAQLMHDLFDDNYLPQTNYTENFKAKVGRYLTYNNKCVLVYRDGNTYLAKNAFLVEHTLKIRGYKKGGPLHVPMIYGEKFVDPNLRDKWDKLL